MFKMLSVVGAYEYAGGGHLFCEKHFVRSKVGGPSFEVELFAKVTITAVQAMEEIHKLRAQISNIVSSNFPDSDAGFIRHLKPPTERQVGRLRFFFFLG